jgi:hypothetical protein
MKHVDSKDYERRLLPPEVAAGLDLEERLTAIERRLDALEMRPGNTTIEALAERTTNLNERLQTLEAHPVLEPEPMSG